MGGSRRQGGRRRGLRARRQALREERAAEGAALAEGLPQRRRRGVRETINSLGGPVTIGIVGVAIAGVLALFLVNLPSGSSDDAPLGEPRANSRATHVSTTAEMNIIVGEPPTGGPHFATPQRQGIYDEPIEDGNAVHALEHGLVWISYNAGLVSAADIEALEDVANDFRRDVILAPRPENEMAVAIASWDRILRLDAVDGELLREFVRTNRDRSPEPGIR